MKFDHSKTICIKTWWKCSVVKFNNPSPANNAWIQMCITGRLKSRHNCIYWYRKKCYFIKRRKYVKQNEMARELGMLFCNSPKSKYKIIMIITRIHWWHSSMFHCPSTAFNKHNPLTESLSSACHMLQTCCVITFKSIPVNKTSVCTDY